MAMTICSCLDREARGTFPIEESLAGKLYFRMYIPVSKWVTTCNNLMKKPLIIQLYVGYTLVTYGYFFTLLDGTHPQVNQPMTSECYVHLQRFFLSLAEKSKIGLTCCIFLCIYTNYSFIYIYTWLYLYIHIHATMVVGTISCFSPYRNMMSGYVPFRHIVEHSSIETSSSIPWGCRKSWLELRWRTVRKTHDGSGWCWHINANIHRGYFLMGSMAHHICHI